MDKAEYLDMHKKYAGTFILFRPKQVGAEWDTCYVDNVGIHHAPEENNWEYVIAGRTREQKSLHMSSLRYDFNFLFPSVGVLEHYNTVVIGARYPARQWKKALCAENFKVYMPLDDVIQKASRHYPNPRGIQKDIHWTVEEVHSWFNTKYSKYNEALKLLKNNKKQAVALSNQFFITASFYGEGFLIWRLSKPIAEVSLNGEVAYTCKAFEQELKDYFKRNNYANA